MFFFEDTSKLLNVECVLIIYNCVKCCTDFYRLKKLQLLDFEQFRTFYWLFLFVNTQLNAKCFWKTHIFITRFEGEVCIDRVLIMCFSHYFYKQKNFKREHKWYQLKIVSTIET